MAEPELFDVFLSYTRGDQAAVELLAEQLRDEAGFRVWLDKWLLVPGAPRQEAIERGLAASATVAVLIGPQGFGAWQQEEMRVALDARVHQPDMRVIPVLLPGTDLPERGSLPPFLTRHTWVDFRPGLDDPNAFRLLISGIKGTAPGADVAPGEDICPYLGLRPFQEEDARFFFGRSALVQWLIEDLRHDNFLAVIGPSGSGKSSIVRAGLIPALRQDAIPGSSRWIVCTVAPGVEPVTALAAQLLPALNAPDPIAARRSLNAALRADPGELGRVVQQVLAIQQAAEGNRARMLLMVDQFEEVFTLCQDEQERAAFIAALLDVARPERTDTLCVLTMRADFYGQAAAYPELGARLERRQRVISPMSRADLRLAIVEPARLVNLQFEKGLIDTILDDAGLAPGVLPLVEHTLWELWQQRRGRWLTFDAYQAIGGVQGALATRAEEVFASFSEQERATAEQVLIRLTQPGEATEDTRRRADKSELMTDPAHRAAVEAVVQKLTSARLLTTTRVEETGEEVVDVAHEALIRGWPRLQGWLNEDRAGLLVYHRLTLAAEDWAHNRRNASLLYRGLRLTEARNWAAAHPTRLNAVERDFLRQSRNQVWRNRVAWAAGAVAVALLVALVVLAVTGQLARWVYRPLEPHWVTVAVGPFLMGSTPEEIEQANRIEPKDIGDATYVLDGELPQHRVVLSDYAIMRFEVTNREYNQCVRAGVCGAPDGGTIDTADRAGFPVTGVNWEQARVYCEWLGAQLPTEAQWEKAARGDTEPPRTYPWGNEADGRRANVSTGELQPVGSHAPDGDSVYGVSDMAGNVWEWVRDFFHEDTYARSPVDDPDGPVEGEIRALRGGFYANDWVQARSAFRQTGLRPGDSAADVGFRCAR